MDKIELNIKIECTKCNTPMYLSTYQYSILKLNKSVEVECPHCKNKFEVIERTDDINNLIQLHENIRNILIKYGNNEFGDCIIDDICNCVGISPTTIYYNE